MTNPLESFTREVRERFEADKSKKPFDWYQSDWWNDATKQLCVDGWPAFVVPLNCMVRKEKERSQTIDDDLAKALAIIEVMREALMEITAECNSELAQVCPNEDCDYQSIGAVKCVNICDSTLAQASVIAEGKE